MNKKIVSFGDSFIFGSEQQNNKDGAAGWPGRAAADLGCEYQTLAHPGRSNEYIAQQIYSYFSSNTANLVVINWTWMARWEFYVLKNQEWITLGTSCIPNVLAETIERNDAHDIVNFFNNHINAGILWNKFRNLQTINSVQQFLKEKNINTIQTYMDYDMFDIECRHEALTPDYINELQKLIYPKLELFEGQNFLDWSYKHGYHVTELGLHPLEDAHIAAAKLWQARYAQALGI
jgi:hypothetical protein